MGHIIHGLVPVITRLLCYIITVYLCHLIECVLCFTCSLMDGMA